MNRLRVFLSRLRGLVRGRHLDRDLQEQINAHLDEATHEYMQQGLSHEEARRAALRSFGGVAQVQEVHRDMRSFAWLEDARRDIRYALRALQRTPGFAVVAILTLALAIGAATAIFSVIDVALLRPVPYENPAGDRDRSTSARPLTSDGGRRPPTSSGGARQAEFLPASAWEERAGRPVIVDAGTPERLTVGTASEDFLEVFGIFPILGRGITADDRRRGSPLVVLLGHQYWQTRLNGAPDVLGRSIRVADDRATIVGVLPAGFYPETMVWRPHVVSPVMHAMRGTGVTVLWASATRPRHRDGCTGTDRARLRRRTEARVAGVADVAVRPDDLGLRTHDRRAVRCRCPDRAHRVRERRRPSAGPRCDTSARTGHPEVHRRQSGTSHPPAPGGERRARLGRRDRRCDPRVPDARRHRRAHSSTTSCQRDTGRQLSGPGVRPGAVDGDVHRVWPRCRHSSCRAPASTRMWRRVACGMAPR